MVQGKRTHHLPSQRL